MSAPGTIPLPRPTALSRPHWEGCRAGVLRVQRCRDCGAYVFVPQAVCTSCQADALEWVESSGRGTLYSYTTVYRAPRPEFQTPYVVAVVELEEGWQMLTNLVDCSPDELAIGLPVAVSFEPVSDEISLPRFRPRRSG